MPRKRRAPRYPGKIQMVSITIRNCKREEMVTKVNALPFVAYHVETLSDGRKVCITKPGGKSSWGAMKADDFMVWVYDEKGADRWRISHEEIKDDIKSKLSANPKLASELVDIMRKVCDGAEPCDLEGELARFGSLPGMPLDLILKTYKWIWTQEDCNYPNGQGRWMSMNGISEMKDGFLAGK